jgi:hypothetical protein
VTEDLTPVRWEVRAAGDDESASFTDRAAAVLYVDGLQARRPHVQVMLFGFTDDGFPAEDAVWPPRLDEKARSFVAMTTANGGHWEFDYGGANIHGHPIEMHATARLESGTSLWWGEGEDLDEAVLQVRKRFRQGESR